MRFIMKQCSVFMRGYYSQKNAELKVQRQIWDILHGVSSLEVQFTRKILAGYDKQFSSQDTYLVKRGRIPLLSLNDPGEKSRATITRGKFCKHIIIKLSLAYSFRKMFFIGQNLTLIRMGGEGPPPTSFSTVTSANVKIGTQNFLTFSFNPFHRLV